MTSTPSMGQLVIEYLAQHPRQTLAPWQIAKGISARLDGHHVGVGAVINICLHEAAHSRLAQVTPAPLTFAHLARTDSDAGQQ